MKRILLASVLAVAAFGAWAQDEASSAPASSERKQLVRQESLELPGLTACHQCEWRPKPHQMAAQEQCGRSPEGQAKVGLYECGFAPDCERVCNFVRCAD